MKHLKLFKYTLGLIIGVVVWIAAYAVIRSLIVVMVQIPIFGALLYYPSDASWALITIPPSMSIFAASFCSVKISNSSKLLSIFIIAAYILDIIAAISGYALTVDRIAIATVSIISAGICFSSNRYNL